MNSIWKRTKWLVRMAFDRNVTLHKRLLFYLFTLIFAGAGIVLLLVVGFGGPFRAENQIMGELELQLKTASERLERDLEAYEGYGLQLARDLGRSIDLYLDEEGMDLDSLNDRPEELLEIQKLLYNGLNTTIRLGRSSGVFACVDATVNTELPEAEQSRCGVWLRLINVSSNVILSPESILFRGNSEIARLNGLELHNRWNMEFRTDELPGYREILEGKIPYAYFWTNRRNLKGTWEEVLLLMVPLKGSTGKIYGVCGIELNGIHFKLSYPAVSNPYGTLVTVLAPLSEGKLYVDRGMVGEAEAIWINEQESLLVTEKKGSLSQYKSASGVYYGLHREISIAGEDQQEWVVALLMDREICNRYLEKNRLIIMGVIGGSILLLLALAVYLSRRFVQPILQDIEEIREGTTGRKRRYTIKELEELSEFVDRKNRLVEEGRLPVELTSLFEQFGEGIEELSKAERLILKHYIGGHQIADIPSLLCVSMSTVKKHNGNMYKKLGVTSYDELMMYIDLFKRCGRTEQLLDFFDVEE